MLEIGDGDASFHVIKWAHSFPNGFVSYDITVHHHHHHRWSRAPFVWVSTLLLPLLLCFIQANTERSVRVCVCPWIVLHFSILIYSTDTLFYRLMPMCVLCSHVFQGRKLKMLLTKIGFHAHGALMERYYFWYDGIGKESKRKEMRKEKHTAHHIPSEWMCACVFVCSLCRFWSHFRIISFYELKTQMDFRFVCLFFCARTYRHAAQTSTHFIANIAGWLAVFIASFVQNYFSSFHSNWATERARAHEPAHKHTRHTMLCVHA